MDQMSFYNNNNTLTEERIEEMRQQFLSETDDEITRLWRNDLTMEEMKIVDRWEEQRTPTVSPEKENSESSLQIKEIEPARDVPSALDDIRQTISDMRADKSFTNADICEYVKERADSYVSTPEEYREMMEFRARFHHYSFANNAMIYMQNPNAAYLGSFRHFNNLGYRIKPGEKGIVIRRPKPVTLVNINDEWINIKKLDAPTARAALNGKYDVCEKVFFGYGYVFDISQTTCPEKDLPALIRPPEQKVDGETYYNALVKVVEDYGLKFKEADLKSVLLRGYFEPPKDEITINSTLNPTAKLQTLSHEFSHALLHHSSAEPLPTATLEFEAESSAYIALRQAGFDMSDYKFRYISTHLKHMKPEDIQKSLIRIDKCAHHISRVLGQELGIDFTVSRVQGRANNREQAPEANKEASADKAKKPPKQPPVQLS